jgi:hypothetical protein
LLVGIQQHEKYKDNFDVSTGLPSKRRNSHPYSFQAVESLPTKACSFDWHYLHGVTLAKTVDVNNEGSLTYRFSPRETSYVRLGGGGGGGGGVAAVTFLCKHHGKIR